MLTLFDLRRAGSTLGVSDCLRRLLPRLKPTRATSVKAWVTHQQEVSSLTLPLPRAVYQIVLPSARLIDTTVGTRRVAAGLLFEQPSPQMPGRGFSYGGSAVLEIPLRFVTKSAQACYNLPVSRCRLCVIVLAVSGEGCRPGFPGGVGGPGGRSCWEAAHLLVLE